MNKRKRNDLLIKSQFLTVKTVLKFEVLKTFVCCSPNCFKRNFVSFFPRFSYVLISKHKENVEKNKTNQILKETKSNFERI